MIFSKKHKPVATVAINLRPRSGSWGGANQWVAQMVRWLEFTGYAVRFDLKQKPDCVLLTHTGLATATEFDFAAVEKLRKNKGFVPCLHRINDNDIRKETSEMDAYLARSSGVADHTVFVSGWLRDYHAGKWFDVSRAHSVIHPGADPRYFHPIGNQAPKDKEKTRLVTHHWSNHWKKGFDVYQEIDRLLAGPLGEKFELWVIGRWPEEIQWQQARTLRAASGAELASLLRQCHGYVSASRFEPGAMHVVEGLQCGLPLIYHPDTGGTVEWGKSFGVEIGSDLAGALENFAGQRADLRKKLLATPPSGAVMASEYGQLIQGLIVGSGREEK